MAFHQFWCQANQSLQKRLSDIKKACPLGHQYKGPDVPSAYEWQRHLNMHIGAYCHFL